MKSRLNNLLLAVIFLQIVFLVGCGSDKDSTITAKKDEQKTKVEKSAAKPLEKIKVKETEPKEKKPLKPLPKTIKIKLGNGIKLELVKIKAGKFVMGQIGGEENEQPVREVTLTKDFLIGKFEVTQEQYKVMMGNNPSNYTPANSYKDTSKLPVENVTRVEAEMFCNELSKKMGLTPCYRIEPGEKLSETLVFWEDDGNGFRLPTEAEWEYCCRAGTPTKYFWGDEVSEQNYTEYVWCRENADSTGWKNPHAEKSGTQPVGTKSANPWGLHDMYGNVAEWCWDKFSDDYSNLDGDPLIDPRGGSSAFEAVLRGGAYFSDAKDCYSAKRLSLSSCEKDCDHNGFRVVKENWRSSILPRKKSPKKHQTKQTSSNVSPSATKKLALELGNGIEMQFVKIEPGKFIMGYENGSPDTNKVREVTISSSFLCGKYEISQSQFEEIMGYNPSFYKSAEAKNFPVESVSWYEAVSFCNKLSLKAGLVPCYTNQNNDYEISQNDYVECDWNASGYRLPTEAEWEYCCRAGTTSKHFWGDSDENAEIDKYACSRSNSGYKLFKKGSGKPNQVGTLAPNPWGLHDICGNVWEWCWDWYGHNYYSVGPDKDPRGPKGGNNRIVRGGGFESGYHGFRSYYRYKQSFENYKDSCTGFRVVTKS